MTLSQNDINEIRAINGASTTLGSQPRTETTTDEDGNAVEEEIAGEAPYGYILVGALNLLEREAEHMDEYGLALTDLSQDKQDELELAHEALQWHVSELSHILADGFVGSDDAIELENGSTIDLPKAALEATQSKDLPERAGGN